MVFFTADSHFSGSDESVITRDFRPFNSLDEMNDRIIEIWNNQVQNGDKIYHLGDFVNYNWIDLNYDERLKFVKKINADVVLILGNNEKRILENDFAGDFQSFKNYLLQCGFFDVFENKTHVDIKGKEFLLTHCPIDADKTKSTNLFGHIHKCGFVKKYGLNVGVDNHYFKLFTEEDILDMDSRRKFFEDNVYN